VSTPVCPTGWWRRRRGATCCRACRVSDGCTPRSRYGAESSRIDILAEDAPGRAVYIEVKNTTLRCDSPDGPVVCFPDAVTTRGAKHLRELRRMVERGHRAAVVFFVHRGDVTAFDVARDVDPGYAAELDRAAAAGVQVLPLQADIQATRDDGGRWSVSWSLMGVLPWVGSQEMAPPRR
jgi:sugar fermentation stimulation protein A